MPLHHIGRTLTLVGDLLIIVMVLWVHHKLETDKRVDQRVLRSLRQEWLLALVGIVLLVVGYALELLS